MRVHKRIRYNYFHTIQLFKRELMYGTSVSANNLCHMALVAKPERDSAKHRYKLIECMQVAS